jgi:non-homologous end joining protein Ku
VPSYRAYWKGFLKLSFVSRPIALYPATSAAERLSFRQLNRRKAANGCTRSSAICWYPISFQEGAAIG